MLKENRWNEGSRQGGRRKETDGILIVVEVLSPMVCKVFSVLSSNIKKLIRKQNRVFIPIKIDSNRIHTGYHMLFYIVLSHVSIWPLEKSVNRGRKSKTFTHMQQAFTPTHIGRTFLIALQSLSKATFTLHWQPVFKIPVRETFPIPASVRVNSHPRPRKNQHWVTWSPSPKPFTCVNTVRRVRFRW